MCILIRRSPGIYLYIRLCCQLLLCSRLFCRNECFATYEHCSSSSTFCTSTLYSHTWLNLRGRYVTASFNARSCFVMIQLTAIEKTWEGLRLEKLRRSFCLKLQEVFSYAYLPFSSIQRLYVRLMERKICRRRSRRQNAILYFCLSLSLFIFMQLVSLPP